MCCRSSLVSSSCLVWSVTTLLLIGAGFRNSCQTSENLTFEQIRVGTWFVLLVVALIHHAGVPFISFWHSTTERDWLKMTTSSWALEEPKRNCESFSNFNSFSPFVCMKCAPASSQRKCTAHWPKCSLESAAATDLRKVQLKQKT